MKTKHGWLRHMGVLLSPLTISDTLYTPNLFHLSSFSSVLRLSAPCQEIWRDVRQRKSSPFFPPRLSREQTKSIFSNSSLFPSQLLGNLVDVPVTCYTCIRVPREQPYLLVGKGAEREEEYVVSHVSANRGRGADHAK